MIKRERWLHVAAVAYVIITGLSFLFTKVALASGTPLDTLAHRFTAAFVAVVVVVATGRAKVRLVWRRIVKVLPLALLYPLMFFGFQTAGLVHATSAEAGIISAAAPVLTLLFATVFLREKSTMGQSISIAVSVAVVAIVAGVVFLKEPFHYYHLIGSLLIVGGVVGANRLRGERGTR